jgi:hypothetical protein
VSSNSSSSSSSSLSSCSERDRFLPRPRHVISGYSHSLDRFAHCLYSTDGESVTPGFLKIRLTGKYGPGWRRARAGTVSSAGDRRDMPTSPATRGACAPIEADWKPSRKSSYQYRYWYDHARTTTLPERPPKMTGAMTLARAGSTQWIDGLLWRIPARLAGAERRDEVAFS